MTIALAGATPSPARYRATVRGSTPLEAATRRHVGRSVMVFASSLTVSKCVASLLILVNGPVTGDARTSLIRLCHRCHPVTRQTAGGSRTPRRMAPRVPSRCLVYLQVTQVTYI